MLTKFHSKEHLWRSVAHESGNVTKTSKGSIVIERRGGKFGNVRYRVELEPHEIDKIRRLERWEKSNVQLPEPEPVGGSGAGICAGAADDPGHSCRRKK